MKFDDDNDDDDSKCTYIEIDEQEIKTKFSEKWKSRTE